MSDFIPFIGTWQTTSDGRVSNQQANLSFKTYGKLADRALCLVGLVGEPIIVIINFLLAQYYIAKSIVDLFKNTTMTLKEKITDLSKAAGFAYILLPLRLIAQEITMIFGLFFPNNAKKILYKFDFSEELAGWVYFCFEPKKIHIEGVNNVKYS